MRPRHVATCCFRFSSRGRRSIPANAPMAGRYSSILRAASVFDRTNAFGRASRAADGINNSLRVLRDCLTSVARGLYSTETLAARIPWHDSRLTHVLKDMLEASGSNSTVVLAHVASEAEFERETKQTLEWISQLTRAGQAKMYRRTASHPRKVRSLWRDACSASALRNLSAPPVMSPTTPVFPYFGLDDPADQEDELPTDGRFRRQSRRPPRDRFSVGDPTLAPQADNDDWDIACDGRNRSHSLTPNTRGRSPCASARGRSISVRRSTGNSSLTRTIFGNGTTNPLPFVPSNVSDD